MIKLFDLEEHFFPELSVRNFLREEEDIFTPIHRAKIGYPMDIYDTDNAKVFDIVVLDADPKNIEITTKGSVLTVQYDNASKEDENKVNYEYRRITKRSFAFSWKIPDLYCLDKAQVKLKNGILKIAVPKEEKENLKQIRLNIPIDDE